MSEQAMFWLAIGVAIGFFSGGMFEITETYIKEKSKIEGLRIGLQAMLAAAAHEKDKEKSE